jgi:hypothetical protein
MLPKWHGVYIGDGFGGDDDCDDNAVQVLFINILSQQPNGQ